MCEKSGATWTSTKDQRVMSLSAILKLPHTTTADMDQDSSLKAFQSILILCDIM